MKVTTYKIVLNAVIFLPVTVKKSEKSPTSRFNSFDTSTVNTSRMDDENPAIASLKVIDEAFMYQSRTDMK